MRSDSHSLGQQRTSGLRQTHGLLVVHQPRSPPVYRRIHTILYTVARIPNAIARERYPFLSWIMVSHKRQKNTIKMPAASRMSGFIKFHCSISRTKKRSHIRDANTLARTNTILFVCIGRFSSHVVVSDLIASRPSPSLHKGGNSEHLRNRISRYEFVKSIGGGTVDNGPLAPLSASWGSERVGPG